MNKKQLIRTLLGLFNKIFAFPLISAVCLNSPLVSGWAFAGEVAVIKSKDMKPYDLFLEGYREVVKDRIKVSDMTARRTN